MSSNPFHSAYAQLTAVVAERRARRLTPPAPPPPRDSDPQAGEALPEHVTPEREAVLPPSGSAWAWSAEGDSDDGTRR